MSGNIGAIWLRKNKEGKTFGSGVIEINGVKHDFVMVKNKYKKEDKHPEYNLLPKTKDGGNQDNNDAPF